MSQAEQALQDDAPGGENDPLGHGEHVALPLSVAKLPEAHWRHADPWEE